MRSTKLLLETLKSGTIASLVMMPLGFAFKAMGMRVGHYGPKFGALFVQDPTPLFLFAQHIVLGWVSALPLLVLLSRVALRPAFSLVIGGLYGAGYYILVNSLALPLYFEDPLPWELGVSFILPSLAVHVAFGVSVSYFARRSVLQTQNGGKRVSGRLST
jgi:hypothetical protein